MFNITRKTPDESMIIVQRPSGYAVSVRKTSWHQTPSHYFPNSSRGTMVAEWETIAKGLSALEAERVFNARLAA